MPFLKHPIILLVFHLSPLILSFNERGQDLNLRYSPIPKGIGCDLPVPPPRSPQKDKTMKRPVSTTGGTDRVTEYEQVPYLY